MISLPRAAQDLVDEIGRAFEHLPEVRPVGRQPAALDIFAERVDRRQARGRRRNVDRDVMRGDKRIGADEQRVDLAAIALIFGAISGLSHIGDQVLILNCFARATSLSISRLTFLTPPLPRMPGR